MSTRMLLTMLLGVIVLLAIGCAGSDEPSDDAADETASVGGTDATDDAVGADPDPEETGPGDVDPTEEGAAAAGGADGDWCALLPTDEVEGLFDGQLELEDPRSVEAGGCRWPVVGAEGEGLMAVATTPGTFEALAGYEDQSGVETERLDLGEEALLLNGADLVVRRDGGGEIRVALQAFFLSEDMGGEGIEAPDAAVARQGIIELATLVLERT
jgi:hypothetical protein